MKKRRQKSINEEARFLLKMLGDLGEVIRAHLRKKEQLKLAVGKRIGKAFDAEETQSLTEKAKLSRSPHMYPAFMLARNAGLRDTEIKTLTWGRVNLKSRTLQVGKAKSDAGEGRIIPLNSELYEALITTANGIESDLELCKTTGICFRLASLAWTSFLRRFRFPRRSK